MTSSKGFGVRKPATIRVIVPIVMINETVNTRHLMVLPRKLPADASDCSSNGHHELCST